ncbi:DNA/RNA nuclease SfsA [Halalkalibacterium ligniniphilum]|uniref:DNA/RNA nuclease SfsA n=1 Tax=Halalkalibacterium ligniniphilum TaxID=1134413 RepID=UPI000344FBCE|nr:DNA/RNA nuclease SfsA [Halalkalibacterium ligniniphilum]
MKPLFFPFTTKLYRGIFIDRPNRFIVEVKLEHDEVVTAHLPDPGRLIELLVPGCSIWVRYVDDEKRKTKWSVVLCETQSGEGYVSLDTTLPNRLIAKGLQEKQIEPLKQWNFVRAEYLYGGSRWDFLLENEDKQLLLEVKSVTLVENRIAHFPDAVTARGAKHVRELTEIQQTGNYETAILFVVQREDADVIRPAFHIDPFFSESLVEAARLGVQLYGHTNRLSLDGVALGKPIPIEVREKE